MAKNAAMYFRPISLLFSELIIHLIALPTLRANIVETCSGVVITEQGEKRQHCEHGRKRFGGTLGFAGLGTERGRA
jgi:hypothetical protein